MIERTGNRIADPDSVFDEQGRRRLNPDGSPVEARCAPGSMHNVRDDAFLGKREKEVRRFGPIFYEEAEQAATATAEPATAFIAEQEEAVKEIERLGKALKQNDAQAKDRLQAIHQAEYTQAGGPRGAVKMALIRAGVKKEWEDAPEAEDTEEE